MEISIITSILILSPLYVHGEGLDSPDACDFPDDNIQDGESGATGSMNMLNAGSGKTITGVCIKSGSNTFGTLSHSGLINLDGKYGNSDCYTVEGIGTSKVTVTKKDVGDSDVSSSTGGSTCKGISHVDYFIDMVIGGSGFSIDKTPLLVAGAQTNAIWIIPVLVAGITVGIIAFRKF